MKLLVAAITFVATLGMLFLIEAGKSPKEDYAQIIEALKEGSTNATVSATPSPIKTQFRTPAPTQTPAKTPSPTPPPISSSSSPIPSTAPATLTPTPTPPSTSQPTPEQSEKININTAGLGELDNITGVGPVIAQRIVDYRNANGLFQRIEDIKKIKGIGDITFEKMKDEITI